jgi:sterol 3beta-glucosyltransferase
LGGKVNVTLLTIGSHGDVLPCIALTKTLKKHGHKVRIAALEGSKNLIVGNNIEYLHISGDAKEVIKLLIGKDVKPLEYFKSLNTLLDPIEEEFLTDIEQCCENTDVVLYSVLGSIVYHAAQAKKVPCIRMLFVPLDPTGRFPAMTAPILGNFALYNKFTYWVGDLLWNDFTKKRLNTWRKNLGLNRVNKFPYRTMENGSPVQTLYAFSEFVLQKPKDWGEHIHLTGYWLTDDSQEYVPSEKLKAFLENGEPPIYVGFGSMVGGDFKRLLSMVIKGIEKAGARAVLSSGWGGLSAANLPESIIQVGYIPHEWLFQRVSMVIHHGGAGTIAAGLSAGKPTIVVPFGGDQPFWGNQIYKIEAGPKPIPIRKFSSDLFAERIMEVKKDERYRRNAEHIMTQINCENGKEKAVKLIEMIAAGTI